MNPELESFIKQSFLAHMEWTIPKIRLADLRLDSRTASSMIQNYWRDGATNPKNMQSYHFYTPYGQKVLDTYKEIYYNQIERFVDGRGTEACVERIL